MLCVCESCLNVLCTGKQTQTVSRKYRENKKTLKANKKQQKTKKPQQTYKHLKTIGKKQKFSETLGWTPPFLKTSPELVFLFFWFSQVFLFFWRFLGCYWFSQGFSYLGQPVFLLFRSTFKYICEPKSHPKTYVICSYNESV